jgi:hypothetical protein
VRRADGRRSGTKTTKSTKITKKTYLLLFVIFVAFVIFVPERRPWAPCGSWKPGAESRQLEAGSWQQQ